MTTKKRYSILNKELARYYTIATSLRYYQNFQSHATAAMATTIPATKPELCCVMGLPPVNVGGCGLTVKPDGTCEGAPVPAGWVG